jgi:hypothetical protein
VSAATPIRVTRPVHCRSGWAANARSLHARPDQADFPLGQGEIDAHQVVFDDLHQRAPGEANSPRLIERLLTRPLKGARSRFRSVPGGGVQGGAAICSLASAVFMAVRARSNSSRVAKSFSASRRTARNSRGLPDLHPRAGGESGLGVIQGQLISRGVKNDQGLSLPHTVRPSRLDRLDTGRNIRR